MNGIESFINELGNLSYVGVFLISIIANVFVPFPEEVVILGLGYLSGTGHAKITYLIPIVILGSIISDAGMYYLSLRGNKFINIFYQKIFSKKTADKIPWIKENINKVIFFSRFMVQLRFLGPFFAGQIKMPFKKFLMIDFLALSVYIPLFLFLGKYFHKRISFLVDGINVFKNILLIIFGAIIIFSIFKILKRKVKNIFEKISSEYKG